MKIRRLRRAFLTPPARRRRRVTAVILSFCVIVGMFCMFDIAFRGALNRFARGRMNQSATQAINQAIAETLRESEGKYDHLVTLEQRGDGTVMALTTDMARVNQLKAAIVLAIGNQIEAWLSTQPVTIPLGTLIGSTLFAGKGPEIPLRFSSVGSAKASFASAFTSAGINQSRHQLLVETTVSISLISPGYNFDYEISDRVAIADTVLLGNVPESYTYIDDTRSSTLEKINDYTR